jgi:hypothetical protein
MENEQKHVEIARQYCFGCPWPITAQWCWVPGVAGDWTKSVSVKEGLTMRWVIKAFICQGRYFDDTVFAKRVNVFGTEIDIDAPT